MIALALLALGALSAAQSPALQSAAAVVTGDSGWGSVEPPVASDQLRAADPKDDSGWG
ncbi:hypothetical protein ACIPPJ_30035 [Streptomyces sp. NPDC086091]|uniref:hypothetical protein n=1 Tax=Streptomyces sp. NPDC086091 TaxID=3365751 RepID=UPI003813B67B